MQNGEEVKEGWGCGVGTWLSRPLAQSGAQVSPGRKAAAQKGTRPLGKPARTWVALCRCQGPIWF